jgi:hypothetical protein
VTIAKFIRGSVEKSATFQVASSSLATMGYMPVFCPTVQVSRRAPHADFFHSGHAPVISPSLRAFYAHIGTAAKMHG